MPQIPTTVDKRSLVPIAVIHEIARRIAEIAHPERIVLFGSYARGDATWRSDVDFLVIARDSRPKPKRSAPLYSALRDYPSSKDILVYTPEEVEQYEALPGSLVRRAAKEGIVLYER